MTTSIHSIRDDVEEANIEQILRRCQIERERYVAARNKFHRSVCQVCAHPQVDEINRRLLIKIPLNIIRDDFQISDSVMDRHWHYHVRPQIHPLVPAKDGPLLKKHLALMVRRRANAKLPLHDFKKQLNFVLVDLMLIRRLLHGDIAEDGLVIDSPSVHGLMSVNTQILKVAKELDRLKRKSDEDKPPPPNETASGINEDLIPQDQQKVIDEAAKRNQEAIKNAIRTDPTGSSALEELDDSD